MSTGFVKGGLAQCIAGTSSFHLLMSSSGKIKGGSTPPHDTGRGGEREFQGSNLGRLAFEVAAGLCYEVGLPDFAPFIHIHIHIHVHIDIHIQIHIHIHSIVHINLTSASMSEQDTSQRALEGSDSINVGNLSELDFEIELGIIARELAPTWNDSLQAARNATISTADLKESGRATVEQIQEAQQMEVESYQTEEGHRISLWKAMERLDATAACPAAVSASILMP